MASTQVSFDFKEWKRIHEAYWESDLTGYRPGRSNTCSWRGVMITFEQVTKIEALRRQIENLQNSLGSRVHIARFGWKSPNDNWIMVDDDAQPLLREAYCKHTVVKIIKLLDESERLGVDVSTSKQTLLEFLEEIKPKQEEDDGLGCLVDERFRDVRGSGVYISGG